MSTQFRSRIKSSESYALEEGATGACCLPDGTKLTGDDVTLFSCNRQNGFFRQGDPDLLQCPDRGLTGCCCSCSNIRDQEGVFDRFLYNDEDSVFTENTIYYDASRLTDDMNDIGLKDNVTQCECFKRQGNWFYGKCSEIGTVESLCGHYENISDNPSRYDVRIPAACCHGSQEGDDVELTCTDVCTQSECRDLADSSLGEVTVSVFNGIRVNGSGLLCDQGQPPVAPFDNNIMCSVDAVQGNQRQAQTIGDKLTDIKNEIKSLTRASGADMHKLNELVRKQRELLGSQLFPCLELKTENNELVHTCSQKTSKNCFFAGGYSYPRLTNKIDKCSDVTTYIPKRGSGGLRYVPATTSSSNMPEEGSIFQGGVYAGIFTPGESTIKLQKNKKVFFDKARNIGPGASNKKWGLIISTLPYDPFTADIEKFKMNASGDSLVDLPTSYYDGFFNTYGDGSSYFGYTSELFENIRSLKFNGFVGWYVPSIDELSFLYSKLHPERYVQDGIRGILSNKHFGQTMDESFTRGYQIFGKENLLVDFSCIKYFRSKMLSSTLVTVDDITGSGSVGGSQLISGKRKVFCQNMAQRTNNDGRYLGDDSIGSAKGNEGLVTEEIRSRAQYIPLVQRIYIND
jgi:hypothetical protein